MITHMPLRSWSRSEFHHMEQSGLVRPHERAELVEGSVVTLPPDDPAHDAVVSHLREVLTTAFEGGTPTTGAVLEPGESSVIRADLAVHDAQGHLVLVVEVGSQETRAYDHHEKASLYAWAGAPEYWVLDLEARRLEVHRRPGHSRRRPWGWGFQNVLFLDAGDAVEPLHGRGSCPVAALFPSPSQGGIDGDPAVR